MRRTRTRRLFHRTSPTHPINEVTAPLHEVIAAWDADRRDRQVAVDVRRGLDTMLVDYPGLADPMVARRFVEGIPDSPGGLLLDQVLADG